MTGSNNKTRDITSNRKYLIKNARGQAAYKARMREAGYKQIAVWVREDIREAERQAKLKSDALLSGAAQHDPLGWMVGFAEGLRQREKKTATRSKPARQHE